MSGKNNTIFKAVQSKKNKMLIRNKKAGVKIDFRAITPAFHMLNEKCNYLKYLLKNSM